MKKNILLLLMSLLFLMATAVYAEECCEEDTSWNEDSCCIDETNFYVKILGGANFLQTTSTGGIRATYQPGYIVAGSLGYCWHYGLCVEAEYAYRRNALKELHFSGRDFSMHHGNFQVSSYMANLLWNFPLSSWGGAFWNIQPFIGAGIGYDFQQMHSSNSSYVFTEKWNHFSWQAMAGLAFPIFCNAEITLEYKFHQGGCHFYNHSLGVGLVYKFCFFR